MKTSWTRFFRRVAATCMVGAATSAAWTSAICYAQSAFDSASDPVYADGWDHGDNGGFGFTPWNFDSAYITPGGVHGGNYSNPGIKEIDDGLQNGTQFSNPFNDVGQAWVMSEEQQTNGAGRAGRGFSPLQIGQTISVVFDNPGGIDSRVFFKGYFIRLSGNTGGLDGNICSAGEVGCTPGGTPVKEMRFQRFEYFTHPSGVWQLVDGDPSLVTPLFDTDTDSGARFSVTRTGVDSYDVEMDPFGPGDTFTTSRTFDTPGTEVDWIEFTIFTDLDSDTGEPPTLPTDFYIRSIEISSLGMPGDFNGDGVVNAADYTVWRDHLGAVDEAALNGNGNGMNGVDQADYQLWVTNFGANATATGAAAAAIPEPGSCVLLIVGAWGVVAGRRVR